MPEFREEMATLVAEDQRANCCRLVNYKSGLVLGVYGSLTNQGAMCVQWTRSNPLVDQEWIIGGSYGMALSSARAVAGRLWTAIYPPTLWVPEMQT